MDQVLIDLDDAWQDLSVKSLIAANASSKVTEAAREAEDAFRDAHRDLLSTLMNSDVDATAVIQDLRQEPAGKLTIAIARDTFRVNTLASATESAEALHNAFTTWTTARDAASAFQNELPYQNLFVEPDDYAEARSALLCDAQARQVLQRLRFEVLDGLKRLEDRVAAKQRAAPVEPEPPAPPGADEMASIMDDLDVDEPAPVATPSQAPDLFDTSDEDLERFAPPTPRAEQTPPVVAAPVETYQAPVRETPAPSSSTFKRIDMQTGEIFDETPALFDEEPPMKPAVSSVNQGAYPTAMPAAMPVKKNTKALPLPLIGGVLALVAVVGGLWLGHGSGKPVNEIVAAPLAAALAVPAVPPVASASASVPPPPIVAAPAPPVVVVHPSVVTPPAKPVVAVMPNPVALRHVDEKPRARIEHRHTDSAADNAEVANASKALDRYFAPH